MSTRRQKGTAVLKSPPLDFSEGKGEAYIGHAEFYHHENEPGEEFTIKMGTMTQQFIYGGLPYTLEGNVDFLSFFRNLTAQLALVWLYFTVSGAAASYIAQTGGTNYALQAFVFAIIRSTFAFGIMMYRTTRNLPINLNATYAVAELAHFRQGLIVTLSMVVVHVLAALATWGTLIGITLVPISPNFATGAAGAFSTGGAILFQILVGVFLILAAHHNMPLDLHSYYYKKEGTNLLNYVRLALIQGSYIFGASFVGWMTGMWAFNPGIWFATALASGGFTTPNACAPLIGILFPMIGGILGWALHLWTWNQQGVSQSVLKDAAKRQKAAQYGIDDDPNNKLNRI